jgi:hypothetical protein
MEGAMEEKYFTRGEAAERLGIAPTTLWRWETEPEKYPGFPGGGLLRRTERFHPTRRRYRYTLAEIEKIRRWKDRK